MYGTQPLRRERPPVRTPKKRGRRPLGLTAQMHFWLPEALKDWVDTHPEGSGPFLRRLIVEAMAREADETRHR